MVEWRLDFQNLPKDLDAKWPDDGYATILTEDWSAYRHERAEILQYIRSHGITGVAAIAGDRHAFEAGLVSPSLAPDSFDPTIPEFITASISAPGLFESAEYSLSKDHPLRPVYLYQPASGGAVQPGFNFSMIHGVRSSLALQRTGDLKQALAETNRQLAPQLSFVDVSAHGYSVVSASSTHLDVEFVCIPRPLERSEGENGGPVKYRITHRVERWNGRTRPAIKRTKAEGTLPLDLE
jgi:alkaline phosphatase D